MRSFLVALAFLTIIPIRFREPPDDATVARARFWFPVLGLLLGLILGGWTYLVAQFAPPMIGAFLVLVVWVVITGALHIDGFCDLCDGLFGGSTPEERLRIMKDPHVGTFGVVGGVLLLLGKFVCIYQLMSCALPNAAPLAVGWGVALARFLVLTVAAGARYPREEGTGKVIVEAARDVEAVVLCILGIMVLVPFPYLLPFQDIYRSHRYILFWHTAAFELVIVQFVAAWLPVVALRKLCERRLEGITGDCLGAGIEVAETMFLLVAVVIIR